MESNTYYVKYPVLQIRPYGLLVYDRLEWLQRPRKKDKPLNTSINHSSPGASLVNQNLYTGQITDYSKKRLKRAISLMVASAKDKEAPNFKTGKHYKFKVNFITLTLPAPQGEITDKQIKKHCLDNWIKRAKRKYKLNSYVWRAERQKNGNIHFHIITDTWIHYEKVRNDWNSCLQQFGFIDQFESKHGHRNPNSTDVHAIWKVRNVTQYFIKYMTKGETLAERLYNVPFARRKWHEKLLVQPGVTYKRVMTVAENKIEGKIWDCSQNLKHKGNCEMLLEGDQLDMFNRAYEDPTCEIRQSENFCIIFLTPLQFTSYITGRLKERWEEYLSLIRGDALPEPQPCG